MNPFLEDFVLKLVCSIMGKALPAEDVKMVNANAWYHTRT